VLELAEGVKLDQKSILMRLTDLQYDRNDYGFTRGSFRVRGEDIDFVSAYLDQGLRIVVKNGKIEKLLEFDPLTGDVIKILSATVIYPAKHYMTNPELTRMFFRK